MWETLKWRNLRIALALGVDWCPSLETDISFDLTIFTQPLITDRGTFNLPYVGLEPPTPGFELRASKIRGEDLTVALSQLNEIHNVTTTPLNISLISIYDEHQNFSKLMSVLTDDPLTQLHQRTLKRRVMPISYLMRSK